MSNNNKIILVCEVCLNRNYNCFKKESRTRLELNKYCKYCNAHTLHKETR